MWITTVLLLLLSQRSHSSQRTARVRWQSHGNKELLKPRVVDGVELSYECVPP